MICHSQTEWNLIHSSAHYDPLENVETVGEFEHDDPGFRADPEMRALLTGATKAFELSPHCGTELHGAQLVSRKIFIRFATSDSSTFSPKCRTSV